MITKIDGPNIKICLNVDILQMYDPQQQTNANTYDNHLIDNINTNCNKVIPHTCVY